MQEGNLEQLIGRIQQKTGEGREAIERFFSEMASRGRSAVAHGPRPAATLLTRQATGSVPRYDNAGSVIRHHPTETVIAAFGIGLVAGLITGLAIRAR